MRSRNMFRMGITVILMSIALVACGDQEPSPPTPVPPTATPAATPTLSANEHIDRGVEYLDQDQLDQASAEFQAAIQLDPENANAHYDLGVVHYKQDEIEEAMAAFQQALQLDPDHGPAHNNLGLVYEKLGEMEAAAAEYEAAIQANPDDDTAHYNLAGIYYSQGLLDEAIVAYRESTRINPDNADAHYNLGRMYYEQGRLDEAIGAWQATARLTPDDSMTHNNLGRAYYDQGQFDQAITELEQSIELDPENPMPYFNLGLVYRQSGQNEEAATALETYLSIVPPDDPNREMVEQEVIRLREASASMLDYRNDAGGYGLLYPNTMSYQEDGTWAIFSPSEAAAAAAFDYATGEAIQEAPIVMFDVQPLADMVEETGLKETANSAEFLQAVAEQIEAETGDVETGTINGYAAALAPISGEFESTPYNGGLAIILVEDRVIGVTSITLPDQWESFRSVFVGLLDGLTFFEPQE